jgi:hypothetical protein
MARLTSNQLHNLTLLKFSWFILHEVYPILYHICDIKMKELAALNTFKVRTRISFVCHSDQELKGLGDLKSTQARCVILP